MRKTAALRNARQIQDLAASTPRPGEVRRRATYAERLVPAAEQEAANSPYTEHQMKMGERIENWQRANRWFRSLGKARSLEGNFRPPRGVEIEYETGDPPPKPPQIIDILDAWELELAWRGLHRKARWILKFHYHSGIAPTFACYLMRSKLTPPVFVHAEDWDDYRRSALWDLRAELDRRVVDRVVGKVPISFDYKEWLAESRGRAILDA